MYNYNTKPSVPQKYRVVYTPSGAAREYSELAVNIATGCVHGCKYCYAPGIRRTTREDFKNRIIPRKDFEKKLALDLRDMKALGDRRRVLLCFMTDCYQPQLADQTRRCLELFNAYGVNFQVLTKNGRLATKDFDLYKNGDAYAATIVFSKEESREYFEPDACTTDERIESLKEAHKRGIETWVSLEPVLYPEQALEVIEMTKEYVDHYKIGKVSKFSYEGDEAIDWRKFTRDVTDRLKGLEKGYYIKNSLRQYI